MRRGPRTFAEGWPRYVMAVAIVGIVVAIRAYVIPAWSLAHPYVLFYPAILLASWLGGFGPGVLATALAVLSLTVLWLPPLYSLRIQGIDDASGLMVFGAIGFAISLFGEARLHAERRAHAAEEELRLRRERRSGP